MAEQGHHRHDQTFNYPGLYENQPGHSDLEGLRYNRSTFTLSDVQSEVESELGIELRTRDGDSERYRSTERLVEQQDSRQPSPLMQSEPSLTKRALQRLSSERFSTHRPQIRSERGEGRRESQVLSELPDFPQERRPSDGLSEKSGNDVDPANKAEKRLAVPTASETPFRDVDLVSWDGPIDPVLFSTGTQASAREFGVSPEVMVLGTSLIVLGMAFGPIIFGPLSELYGRKRPLFIGFVVFTICQIPVAVAPNVATIFIFRFLQGVFGAAPLTIVGGALVDLWAPVDRGVAVSVFSCFTFAGPTFGPLLGGFVCDNPKYGWRWTAWITLIMSLLFGAIAWLAYPESFGPVLLQARARKLRFQTKNWAIHAPADEVEIDMAVILKKYLAKPFAMLVLEPILLLITIYISFIYGILCMSILATMSQPRRLANSISDLFFETYPISFYGERGWSLGKSGLPFIAIIFGVILGGFVNVAFIKTRYTRILREKGRVPPEERLLPMMVGSVALPVGLFLFAWTSDPSFNPALQILAGVPAGMGIVLIFLQGFNYIIDVYMMFANSAIAANTFVRSAVGAAFPMLGEPESLLLANIFLCADWSAATFMYGDLGVKWATTLLGFIAVALMPVPVLFFIYGPRIRKMSRFAPQMPAG
nr:putative transporter c36.03c [Quercus suber]